MQDASFDGRRYIFDWKLAKRMGIYQILNPDAGKTCGYNPYRAVAYLGVLCLGSVSALFPLGMYHLAGEANFFTFYLGCVINLLFSCYKLVTIARHSDGIWACTDVSGRDFVSYPRYDRTVFRRWRGRSARVSYLSIVSTMVAVCFWIASPVVFDGAVVTVGHRGRRSSDNYRMNVFNMHYPLVSDATYNAYFGAFFAVEIVLAAWYFYFTIIFEVLMIMMCSAFSCQLETISEAIKALGHGSRQDGVDGDPSISNVMESEKKHQVYDELKMIIADHQKVMKKMEDYYHIFWSIMLTQIFVASSSEIILWFIFAMSYSVGEEADSILSIKVFTILPMTTFQLFMTCHLFGIINEKKDSIIFALYSSQWTEMDMKSKKLILYAMKTNNANQLKIKFTNNKIVNLEMFTNTIRACYSIFSMLINYNKNKRN